MIFEWTFYEEVGNRNLSEGIHQMFIYNNDITSGLFVNMLLFAIFMIFALGTYYKTRESQGSGDLPMSFAVSGFITIICALLLSFVKAKGNFALVSPATFGILFSLYGIFMLWFFFKPD